MKKNLLKNVLLTVALLCAGNAVAENLNPSVVTESIVTDAARQIITEVEINLNVVFEESSAIIDSPIEDNEGIILFDVIDDQL